MHYKPRFVARSGCKRKSIRRRMSFGISIDNDFKTNPHFKKFLIAATIILIRSVVQKKSSSTNISSDMKNIEENVLELLTIKSILELLEYMVGKENLNKIILLYTSYKVVNMLF